MAEEQTATVQVAEGALRGRRVASSAGGSFWSFQGVPYARPPLGPLRFKDAQAMKPWQGVRDAFKEGDNCSQFNRMVNAYVGSENCLFVNVYTPKLPGEGASKIPVMVYIHGGAFELGSGDTDMYGPDYLVADDVILVTFNYRLGVLGFLKLGNEAPGNTGLKDQVAALHWVQKNIAAFGGDPGNVTLFGGSAGSASVHFQMLSPLSKGLFHRAIAMSGVAMNKWAVQTDQEQTARRVARALGCTSEDDDAMVQFLRGVDHMELLRAVRSAALPEEEKDRFVKFSFVPTPERVVPGVETFLPAPVEQLMKEGRHHDVSFMAGVTNMEAFVIFSSIDITQEEVAREVDGKWEANVLPELRLPAGGERNKLALAALRDMYMQGKPLSEETLRGYLDMFTDILFGEGVTYALRSIAKSNSAPVYQYFCTVDDDLNLIKKWQKVDMPGTRHGDEIGYFFSQQLVSMDVPEDSSAALTRKRCVRLWTNYAKTGNPTPGNDPLIDVVWKPYTEKERHYLEIGNELKTGTDLYAERVAFWEKFYATYAA